MASLLPAGLRSPGRAALLLPLLAALLLLPAASPRPAGEEPAPPRARGGVLDLRGWDFSKGAVELAGDWEFAAGAWLEPSEAWPSPPGEAEGFRPRPVPEGWSGGEAGGEAGRGGGSYRLLVLLPPEPGELALSYTTVATAFELFANGSLAASAGRPDLDPGRAVPAYRPAARRLPPSPEGRLELLVRVSNHEYREGGLWRPFVLGPAEEAEATKARREALALGLAAGLAGMALHSLILFLHRRKERSYLYFALFSSLIALRSLVTGEYFLVRILPGLPFDLLIRLEYVSAYLSIPAATLFFLVLFSAETALGTRLALLLPHLPFALLIPWAPLPLLTRSILAYYPVAALGLLGTLVLVLARAARRGRPGSLALLAASLLLALTAANDMLFASFILRTGNLLPYALAAFILAQDFALSRRFTSAFDEAERLSGELGEANEALKREVAGHREARERLEELLAEKETHLREIHHRVKNSLQIVSSIAALQAHRSGSGETAAALAALRERIRAISLVHEQLYGAGSGELLDLGEYAQELAERLSKGLGSGAEVELEAESLPVAMDLCVDLGLAMAELAANAFRHGRVGEGGRLRLRLGREGEELVLVAEDGGPGYPEGFTAESSPSLGFKIVLSVARKRGGSLRLSSPGGARAELRLPLAPA